MTTPQWKHEGQQYGHELSYQKAAEYLSDCAKVEDWGGGPGYARKFFPQQYRLIDGTPGYGADLIINLVNYLAMTDGILLRHVLEHNEQWDAILDNALQSCKKLALVIFTPFADTTQVIAMNSNVSPPVPDISFLREDLTSKFKTWTEESFVSNTQYGGETIFYVRGRR